MEKEEKIKFDFIPNNSFRHKIIGIVILGFCFVYYVLKSFFHWSILDNGMFELILAVSLFLISFSKEKQDENNNTFYLKYYAGKITSTFIISFIISLNIYNKIKNNDISLDIIEFVILALFFYQILLNIFIYIFKNKEIEVKEVSINYVYRNHPKFILFSIFFAVITLFFIIILRG